MMELLRTTNKDYRKEFTFDLGREVKEDKHVTVSFYVGEGGINYFTYKTESKGYYISVTPQTVENHGGYTTVKTTAFSGLKMLLKEISRKSKKQFELCINEIDYVKFYCLCLEVDSEMTKEEAEFMYHQIKENW